LWKRLWRGALPPSPLGGCLGGVCVCLLVGWWGGWGGGWWGGGFVSEFFTCFPPLGGFVIDPASLLKGDCAGGGPFFFLVGFAGERVGFGFGRRYVACAEWVFPLRPVFGFPPPYIAAQNPPCTPPPPLPSYHTTPPQFSSFRKRSFPRPIPPRPLPPPPPTPPPPPNPLGASGVCWLRDTPPTCLSLAVFFLV